MNFEEYQKETRKTAIYPNKDKNFVYPTLGIAGESGEIAEKVKKIYRDKDGIFGEEDREELAKELGDILWYVANLATELGISLDKIALKNIEKITSRMKRDQLHGNGDNR
jgi:NTP pyrophosphatase (non-canonical NTP hydrolase)